MSAAKQTIRTTIRQGVNFIAHHAENGYIVTVVDSEDANPLPAGSYTERRRDRSLELTYHSADPRTVAITIIG